MVNPLVKTLQDYRNQILFIELCGLLHDIGKLSKAFLEYRQKWQDDPHGYDKDPHDHDYLDKHEVFKTLVPQQFEKITIKDFNGNEFSEDNFSIKKALQEHTKKDSNGDIMKMLKAADKVDSAIDRNNPLWSNEQKTGNIYRSNVFGYETGRIVDLESHEKARQELYIYLNRELSSYLQDEGFRNEGRSKILKQIKKAFEQGLSDTTRPQNDTTLWEHSYAVASILKVISVHNLLNATDKIYKQEDVKFGILGIGWDGMRFISYGQKIGDIIGRRQVIEDIKSNVRELIEHTYPIGSVIYDDDDGIYFIVPAQLKSKYSDLWEEIERNINSIASKESNGELQPYVELEPETQFITNLVKVINKLKNSWNTPFSNQSPHFDIYKSEINKHWQQNAGKTICPICRLRPVEKEDEDDKKKICKICNDRRKQIIWVDKDKNIETVFIDEIVDINKRACLIVTRFGLDRWLNGDMVRSLFVTETKGIERDIKNLGNVKQFVNEEEKLISNFPDQAEPKYCYQRIVDDIDSFYKSDEVSLKRATSTAFLYYRRNSFNPDLPDIRKKWDQFRDSSKKEIYRPEKTDILLYNILCAKTPTPSTVLDVWDTTLEFFEHTSQNILKGILPENNRLSIIFDESISNWGGATLEAEVIQTGKKIEMIFNKDKKQIEVVGEIYSKES